MQYLAADTAGSKNMSEWTWVGPCDTLEEMRAKIQEEVHELFTSGEERDISEDACEVYSGNYVIFQLHSIVHPVPQVEVTVRLNPVKDKKLSIIPV